MARGGAVSLGRLLALTLAVSAVGVAGAGWFLFASARRAIVERSERLREGAALRIEGRIEQELGEAADVVGDVERVLAAGVAAPRAPEALEAALYQELLSHPGVAEVAFTRDGDGDGPWQVALFRPAGGQGGAIHTRIVRRGASGFAGEVRERAPGDGLHEGAIRLAGGLGDPSEHPTFTTTASPEFRGRALWSDLHRSQLDEALPEREQRIVVGVQKALLGGAGGLLGVVRVELLASAVDELARVRVDEGDPGDPHRVFLCDRDGRLLTRLAPEDRLVLDGDDLRVAPARIDPAIDRALQSPLLAGVSAADRVAAGAFEVPGRGRHLVTFRALPGSQGWILGIVVPEQHYTRDLRALVMRFAAVAALSLLLALAAAGVVVRALRRGFRGLTATTARMRAFDFAAGSGSRAPVGEAAGEAVGLQLAEVAEVEDGLERARTALRALARYVPVDLVHQLYLRNSEPRLGGEPRPLTLLFSDIEGFTGLAERLAPDALAAALGAYLDAMTRAIRATDGTIDKFIGDSVMAFWNAPAPLADHAARACRAVLACEQATRALYASEAWRGLPPLTTRFGLHTDTVLVGHFGASERLSYTAVGDGVNLASRLEGLCKEYGVTRLASEAVVEAAGAGFAFRRIDRVAVKGKSRAVMVHELLGPAGSGLAGSDAVRAYDAALDDYFARRFDAAIGRLLPHLASDPPSRVLAARCHQLVGAPPPASWDGTYVARSK